ncbi:hypothetical protein EHS25_003828 [Saitozyma podzolica]|uniref:Translation initiation factor eIF2B subunit delta n=1 Tax=Saitozyma podzolica TaxID=1890683 RepID=A0A427Y3M4_9TREE|nr:hypothetical protein EHS25_003828 [Saitozyma podzolica]
MSSPPTQAPKAPKHPKPAKAPQPSTADAPKAKSAKALKKEKRAAAVAARGGSEGGAAAADHGSRSTVPGAVDGAAGTAGSLPRKGPAAPGALPAQPPVPGPSAPRRPPIPASEGSTFTPSHSTLFFSHLPEHRPPHTPSAFATAKLHPLIVRLGVLMSSGELRGANARTMAMMVAFREVIREYECPDQAVLWKDLPVYLSPMIAWLETCRPKGVGGGNAIRWLKSEINKLGEQEELSEAEQKDYLVEAIDVYLRDRIEFADQVIADNAKEKIKPGDVVVVYARSSVVERVLLQAWRDMRSQDPSASFEVIVVDSRPLLEGRHLLDSLTSSGLPCTYLLLPLLSSLLPRANLVLLGASALHSDGALYSRAGTALVAMLAKEHRVPVVACVETYKFGERVALDGVATNEIGQGAELLDSPSPVTGGAAKAGNNLTPLTLM